MTSADTIPPAALQQHVAILGKTGGRRRLPAPDPKACLCCGTIFSPVEQLLGDGPRCPDHRIALLDSPTRWGRRWGCPVPGCTVACWNGSTSTPADAETRALRHQCHAAFDPLWRRGVWRRGNLYGVLASRLGIPAEDMHFGLFSSTMCLRALAVVAELAATARNPAP